MSTGFTFLLIAQYSKWQRLGDGLYSSRGPTDFGDYIPYLFALLLVGVLVVIIYAHRRANDLTQPCDHPYKLFLELCREHGIDRHSQQILRELAEYRALAQPAEIFVTPSAFATESLPQQLQTEAKRLRELRERLF